MDLSRLTPVSLFCPNCGHKVIGYQSADGALRIICERCGSKIYSKQMKKTEVTIKFIASA